METKVILNKKQLSINRETHLSHLCTASGLIVSAVLMSFFLLMKAFGFHELLFLRFFNFVFLAAGILIAYSLYRKRNGYHKIHYFKGLKMGLHITLLAIIPFTLFIGIYLLADHSFMDFIKHHAMFGSYLTPGLAAGSVFIEGFVSGAIFSYCAMQFFKKEEVANE